MRSCLFSSLGSCEYHLTLLENVADHPSVTITSIVRLVLLLQGLFGLAIFPNQANNVGFVTSAIETNLALITASAPALRPFFRRRENGGFFSRTLVSPTRIADEEKGVKSVGWDTPPSAGANFMSKITRSASRGGARGGRRGSTRSVRSTRAGRGGKIKPIIRVKTDMAELRSSPRSSEEETMTNNGIMRISDIQREIDGIAKEIAATGGGAYIPRPSTAGTGSGRTGTYAMGISLTGDVPTRPSTSGEGRERKFPERYYSESVYPDLEFDNREIRDYNSDRFSRYGDRRFGVVTPKGTTPTTQTPTWKQNNGGSTGRPF